MITARGSRSTPRSLISRVLRVEPEERDLATVVAVVFFATQATHGLSANAADALFFSRFGVESLPQMYMLVGIVASLALLAYASGLGRVSRRRFYPAVLGAGAAVMAVLRVLVELDARWVYAVIWVAAFVTVLVTLTLMWNLAADVADARAAKRLYPLFASAGIMGGIFGNVLTGPLAGTLGTENLLVVAAGILAMVAIGVRHEACRRHISATDSTPGAIADLGVGYRTAVTSPLVRLVGVAMTLAGVLFGAVTFRFSTAVAERFGSEADIASFLGWFSAAATGATFLVSLLVAHRIFARFGIAMAILAVALTYVSGFALWLVSFGLVTASLVRFGQWVMTVGLGVPATTALFNVFRGERRGAVIAFMFAIPANIGVAASGLFLYASERWLTRSESFVILMMIALGYTVAIWQVRRRYGQALVAALCEGSFEALDTPQQGLQNLGVDADLVRAGLTALTDPQPSVRRLAADMLGGLESQSTVDALCQQLSDSDIAVRLSVVEALGRIGASANAPELRSRLTDTDSSVRAATVDVLAVLAPNADVARTMQDQNPVVRARTAVLLASRGEAASAASIIRDLVQADDAESRVAGLQAVADIGHVPEGLGLAGLVAGAREPAVRAAAVRASGWENVAPDVVIEALGDPDERVRSAAVSVARAQGLVDELLGLLDSGTLVQQESALIALEASEGVAAVVMEWAVPLVDAAARLRRLRAHIEAIAGPNMAGAEYLAHLLGEREWQIERLVVRALTQFRAPGVTDVVLRGVRSPDAELRSQALEAIDTLGDSQVARNLLPLLEREAVVATPDIHSTLEELSTDADPWIRALAVRCVAEVVRHSWRRIVKIGADDSFPLVREEAAAAAGIFGDHMADTLQTLSTIDRMLVLRRVQLFASLEPGDLQTIAELATEEIFANNETIYRAGEPGDEMLVVVRGRVRLTKDTNGERHVVSEHGEHDHVGELSALRDAPRSADVEAASEDVRVLVILGGQLRHLVTDRPRVAQAMLASLAERLATLIEEGSTGSDDGA